MRTAAPLGYTRQGQLADCCYCLLPHTLFWCHSAVSASKPLERLKWIAYVAAFFNKEYAANAVYNTVRANYLNLRREVLTTAPPGGEPPRVCWVYKDWDGDFAMSYAQYKVEYIKVGDPWRTPCSVLYSCAGRVGWGAWGPGWAPWSQTHTSWLANGGVQR